MDRDEQFRKNLELVRCHLKQILDNPSAMADIPNGAHIVLIPSDDPELAEANIQLAHRLRLSTRPHVRSRADAT